MGFRAKVCITAPKDISFLGRKQRITLRECKLVDLSQATSGQVLAYYISIFPVGVDLLPKYGSSNVTANCICTGICIKGWHMLTFPLNLF